MKILNLLLLVGCVSNPTNVNRVTSSLNIDENYIKYSVPLSKIPRVFYIKENSNEENLGHWKYCFNYSKLIMTANFYNHNFISKNDRTEIFDNQMKKLSDLPADNYDRDIFIFFIRDNNSKKESINRFINEKNIKHAIVIEGFNKKNDLVKTAELNNLLWNVWAAILIDHRKTDTYRSSAQ